jgi:DNA-directed RNA polymerase subunit RPC12/RpoP
MAIYFCQGCGKQIDIDNDSEDGSAICNDCYSKSIHKSIIIDFLDWYYTESAKTPMRFETDHEDIAMMYLQERSK